jgi:hypothetical protein
MNKTSPSESTIYVASWKIRIGGFLMSALASAMHWLAEHTIQPLQCAVRHPGLTMEVIRGVDLALQHRRYSAKPTSAAGGRPTVRIRLPGEFSVAIPILAA